nr:MAG TPA: hypothetical protein [Caudoviricetes sp.]
MGRRRGIKQIEGLTLPLFFSIIISDKRIS